jgi:hypothetical protein
MDQKLDEISRDISLLLQAMRILGKALGVKDEIDRLTHTLEQRYSTEPGAE